MTSPIMSKIDHPPQTLRDIVQERMREAIISGPFAPGEGLVERPLCDPLGVRRTVGGGANRCPGSGRSAGEGGGVLGCGLSRGRGTLDTPPDLESPS